ncbi:EF-hand calcium-binding domain-containing protein 11 isoform X2 [Fukomys damarensis]|uniref:EF-hand calcium-binding domain-containing protein 11 isoform X2 n=1 Tax=Fukomys damarensis TaxID=885580 RepID=UPI001454F328|nr:EF-hand calcium-binding domain-containing protein 11 isoform X2 [Fukomys damarensis]
MGADVGVARQFSFLRRSGRGHGRLELFPCVELGVEVSMALSEAGARPRTWDASPSEHRKWVEVFKACDEDNKGYLSREDFKVAVVMLFGYKPSKIEADSVMSSRNPNTSGIVLGEFLNIIRKKKEAQLYRNEIRQIFTAFDVHYRGYLTLEDFKKAFRQVAPRLPERTVLEVFSEPTDCICCVTSKLLSLKKSKEVYARGIQMLLRQDYLVDFVKVSF